MTTIDFEEGWAYIQSKIQRLIRGLPISRFTSKEVVYLMCIQKEPDGYSQELYVRYRGIFEGYILSEVLPSLREKHDVVLLRGFVRSWSNHKIMTRRLSVFFGHLDKDFVIRRALPTLKDVGLKCFRDTVYQELKGEVRDVVLNLINQERDGQQIDRALLKNGVDIYLEMFMGTFERTMYYQDDFELAVLEKTRAYYAQKAPQWILEFSYPEYLLNAETCLKREKERVSHYLHHSTWFYLVQRVRHELLVKYSTKLLHEHFLEFLRNDKAEDLSRLYRLFDKTQVDFEPVLNMFKQHVKAEFTTLGEPPDDTIAAETDFVGKVFELYHKFMAYVYDPSVFDPQLHQALNDAFLEVFFDRRTARRYSAELLATFCDDILKKKGPFTHKETVEKVGQLVADIIDRNLFQKLYWDKLEQRLISDEFINFVVERNILSELKLQCGEDFTSNMEMILEDVILAGETGDFIKTGFRIPTMASPVIEMHTTVLKLKPGDWPSYKSSINLNLNLNLPAEMLRCMELFTDSYKQKRGVGRELRWIDSWGFCSIDGKFEQKTIELIVTTPQAAVLLLFKTPKKLLGYEEIKNQLNLSHNHVYSLLHSLSCAKYKILNKCPNTETISQTDVFEFNSKFDNKMTVITIPAPPLLEEMQIPAPPSLEELEIQPSKRLKLG